MNNLTKQIFIVALTVFAIAALPVFASSVKELVKKGETYLDNKQYEEAIKEFSDAIGQDPNCKEAYCNRAYALAQLEEYKEAIEDCNKAIKVDPSFKDAYFNRACAYGWLGNQKKAIDDCTKAIDLGYKDPEVYHFRADCYKKIGKSQLASLDELKAKESTHK
jgi:tetratricopeptide (TPR) repeat protein